jgi:hypothetical protein
VNRGFFGEPFAHGGFGASFQKSLQETKGEVPKMVKLLTRAEGPVVSSLTLNELGSEEHEQEQE